MPLRTNHNALWLISAVTLLILDPITTWYTIENGLGIEANPVLAPVVMSGEYANLVVWKTVVLASVYLTWRYANTGRFHNIVPLYAAGVGTLVVVWNTANILLTITLGAP